MLESGIRVSVGEIDLRWIRLAPMTAESLIVCAAIYLSCLFQATSNRERFEDVQRAWGAICSLELNEAHDGVRRVADSELQGPFDVWKGDWWRIPLTAFHHTDLLHLILNLGAAWYLGSRLEQRWGSFAMIVFLMPAVCLPMMAELCLGQAVIGYSGAICAMLGALVVLRNFDVMIAQIFPADAAEIGMAMIVLGWLASLCDVVSLPNAAHLTGFAYGALIAWITAGPLRHVTLLRVTIVLVHLWLIPGLFLVSHPFWIGRYYWYQAVSARSPQLAERNLERATSRDPALAGAWLRWSQLAEERGDPQEAWRRLVKGLANNPSSAPLIDSTRRLWRHLDPRQRRSAELILAEFFGAQAQTWLNQIRGVSDSPPNSNEEARNSTEPVDVGEFALDQKIDLPLFDLLPARANPQKPKIQIDQNDAMEGETL